MTSDLDKENRCNFIDNYDGKEREPYCFAATFFQHMLVNGAERYRRWYGDEHSAAQIWAGKTRFFFGGGKKKNSPEFCPPCQALIEKSQI